MKLIFLKILAYAGISILAIFVILSVLPYFFSTGTDFDGNMQPFENSRSFKADSVQIHYRFYENDSAARAIIFIHGFSGSTFSWRNNVDFFLRSGYEVLLVDLPAFGFSDRSPDLNHSSSQRSQWLWQLCKKLAPEKQWVIVGHSMGAGVAAAMSAMHPEATAHLVMTDGVYTADMGGERRGGGAFGLLLAYPPVKRWAEVIAVKKFFTNEKFVELLSSAYSRTATSEEAEGYRRPFLVPGTTTAILTAFKNSKEVLKLDYSKISAPKTLIWGTKDAWIKIETAEKFVKKFPDTRLITIEEAGHCPMETHPDIFNEKMLEVLGQ